MMIKEEELMKRAFILLVGFMMILAVFGCAGRTGKYNQYADIFDALENENYDEAIDLIYDLSAAKEDEEEYERPDYDLLGQSIEDIDTFRMMLADSISGEMHCTTTQVQLYGDRYSWTRDVGWTENELSSVTTGSSPIQTIRKNGRIYGGSLYYSLDDPRDDIDPTLSMFRYIDLDYHSIAVHGDAFPWMKGWNSAVILNLLQSSKFTMLEPHIFEYNGSPYGEGSSCEVRIYDNKTVIYAENIHVDGFTGYYDVEIEFLNVRA